VSLLDQERHRLGRREWQEVGPMLPAPVYRVASHLLRLSDLAFKAL